MHPLRHANHDTHTHIPRTGEIEEKSPFIGLFLTFSLARDRGPRYMASVGFIIDYKARANYIAGGRGWGGAARDGVGSRAKNAPNAPRRGKMSKVQVL